MQLPLVVPVKLVYNEGAVGSQIRSSAHTGGVVATQVVESAGQVNTGELVAWTLAAAQQSGTHVVPAGSDCPQAPLQMYWSGNNAVRLAEAQSH